MFRNAGRFVLGGIFPAIAALLMSCTNSKVQRSQPVVSVTSSSFTAETPTPIPASSLTATPTPVAIMNSYNLPAWIQQPHTNIAVTITDWKGYAFQLSFFGEEVNDRFDILIPNELLGYFWLDTNHFGFLADDRGLQILDLQTGQVTNVKSSKESLRHLENEIYSYENIPHALVVSWPDYHSDQFYFVYAREREYFSQDWKYVARFGTDENGNSAINLYSAESGELLKASDNDSNTADVSLIWSRRSPDRLAILKFPTGTESYYANADRILVVDAASGKAIGTYSDEFTYYMDWSPDGEKFVFQKQDRITPCIFYIQTQQHKCAHIIPDTFPGKRLGLFQWKDDLTLLFTYYAYDDSTNAFLGGLCTYDLLVGTITCPTDRNTELKGKTITGYALSPDHRHIVMHLQCSSIDNDYACDPINALMRMDGSNFRILEEPEFVVKQITGDVPFLVDNYYQAGAVLWRPMP